MRRIIGIGAAWMAATLVAVAVAAAAVGSVRSEVTDTPTALSEPIVAAAATAAAPDLITSTTVVVEATTTTVAIDEPSATTTTTQADASSESSVTTTTSPPVTTTTASSYTKTYGDEAGLPGEVTIIVSGDSVTFAGATALLGWKVELENSGPEEVNVHFERNEDEDEEEEIEFRASIEDGELKITISADDS